MAKYRVIQWGVGYTGVSSLRYIVNNPNLELVGIKCFTREKEGLSARAICGHGPDDVTATTDIEQILKIDADCVIFMPRDMFNDPSVPGGPSDAWMAELIAILESGMNVSSPLASCISTAQMANQQAFLDRINAACAKGNSTVTFTGFDPGFATDYMPFVVASAVGEVRQIRTWEMLDYAQYPVAEILHVMGLGIDPSQIDNVRPVIHAIWSTGLHLLGESMGEPIDEVRLDIESYLSPRTFTTPGGMEIREGQTGALWWKLHGLVGGKERYVINHVTRMSEEMGPDWPRVGVDGGYRIEIDSFPPVFVDMPLGVAGGGGTAFADAMIMTAARCVNSIDAVVQATPGYKTFNELAPIGGKYTFVD